MEEDQIQPIKESEKPRGDAKKPDDAVPVASVDVSKIDPPRNSSNSNTDVNKRKRKPLTCFEIWAIVLTIIGIFVAGGTGGAIIWQDIIASRTLVEIQKQYPQLEKSATAADNAATTAQANLKSGNETAANTLGEMQKQSAAMKSFSEAAKSAADTAASQLELAERPWITAKMEIFGPGLSFNANGSASLNLGIVIKNIGHSVATGINVYAEMIPMSFNESGVFKEPIEKQAAVCDNFRKDTFDTRRLFTLFPDDETTANISVNINKKDIDSAVMPFNTAIKKYVLPVVLGCVNYQFLFEKGTHQTRFIYEVSALNAAEPTHEFPIKVIDGTVPLSGLVIRKYYFGESLAD